MKKIMILGFFAITFQYSIVAQTSSREKNDVTFSITQKGNVVDLNPYISAIEKANFSCYHFENNRRKLVFDNGLVVELFSAKEMIGKNTGFDLSCLTNETQMSKEKPKYHLDPSGIIVEIHGEDQMRKY